MLNKTQVARFEAALQMGARGANKDVTLYELAKRNADKLPLSQISQNFLETLAKTKNPSPFFIESEVRSLFNKLEKSSFGGADSLSVSQDRAALFYLARSSENKALTDVLVRVGKVTPSEALNTIIALGERHDTSKTPPEYPPSLLALKQGYREPIKDFLERVVGPPKGFNSSEKFLYDVSTRNIDDIKSQNYKDKDGFPEVVASVVDHLANNKNALPQHKDILTSLLDARQITPEVYKVAESLLKNEGAGNLFKELSANKIPAPRQKGDFGERAGLAGRALGD